MSKALNNSRKLEAALCVTEPRFGAKGDGITDDTAAIQAALTEAAATGSVLTLPDGLTFRSAGGHSVTGGLKLRGRGVLKFSAANQFGLAIEPARSVSTTVSAISTVTFPAGTGIESGAAQLNVGSSAGFVRGDVCHIRSADTYAHTAGSNRGELVEISEVVDGATIVLAAALVNTFATTITLEKLNPAQVDIDGPTFAYDGDPNAIVATPTRLFALALIGCVNPSVKATFRDDVCGGVVALSCWRPDVDVVVKNLRTSASVQYFGYGATAYGATRGGMFRVRADRVRHAYTDGIWPSVTQPTRWGCVLDNVVTGISANAQLAAWDTHPGGINTVFQNCGVLDTTTNNDQTDKNNAIAFQDRGLNTKYIGCWSVGARRPFAFTSATIVYGQANTVRVIGGYHERRGTTGTFFCNPTPTTSDAYKVEFTGGKVVGFVPAQTAPGVQILSFDGTTFVGDATASGLNSTDNTGAMLFRDCTFLEWLLIRCGQSNSNSFVGCKRINSGAGIEPLTAGVGATVTVHDYYAEAASYGSSAVIKAGAGTDAGTVTLIVGTVHARGFTGNHVITNGVCTLTQNTIGSRQTPVKKGTTANRPSLRPEDLGFQYLDTTLAANGKPIWWVGAAWVDNTGTAV